MTSLLPVGGGLADHSHLRDYGHVDVTVTITDPKVFTKPVTAVSLKTSCRTHEAHSSGHSPTEGDITTANTGRLPYFSHPL